MSINDDNSIIIRKRYDVLSWHGLLNKRGIESEKMVTIGKMENIIKIIAQEENCEKKIELEKNYNTELSYINSLNVMLMRFQMNPNLDKQLKIYKKFGC